MTLDLPRLVIGTHHKSGTVMIRNIVRDIASEFGVPVWVHDEDQQPDDWTIYLDFWSKWQIDLDQLQFGGIHLVRRPEALVYSATLYHLRGSEQWLHDTIVEQDRPDGGCSYFDALRVRSPEEQLIFEMNNSSRHVLKRMAEVAADDRFYHLRLEDVSTERSMNSFAEAFLSAGVSAKDTGRLLAVAQRHCLWHISDQGGAGLAHSTTGMSDAWRDAFTPRVYAEFERVFGDLSDRLHYGD